MVCDIPQAVVAVCAALNVAAQRGMLPFDIGLAAIALCASCAPMRPK